MIAETVKVISILLLTMLKFIMGPTLGYAAGYPFIFTVILTIVGMMMSVFLFTFLGNYINERIILRYFKSKKKFTPRRRKFVKIWKKYGIKGVAFLTPLILTPIGGTLLLTSYHTPKRYILTYMLISAIFWAFVFTGMMYFAGDGIKSLIP